MPDKGAKLPPKPLAFSKTTPSLPDSPNIDPLSLLGDQMNEESDEISLQPFSHQVGGHYAMMQLDDHSVCKPLNETELLFYKTAPDAIKEFVPKFKGEKNESPGGPPSTSNVEIRFLLGTLDLNKSGTVASGSTALGTKSDSLCIKDDEERIASGSRTSYNNGRYAYD